MCGLFGFSDLQHSLTEKQASALANSLARASAVRGQDATGIAYVQSGKLRMMDSLWVLRSVAFRWLAALPIYRSCGKSTACWW